MILVVLLVFVLVGVGFWQWQSLSGGEATPQNQSKPQNSQASQETNQSESQTGDARATSEPMASANGSPRDPFRPFETPTEDNGASTRQEGTKVVAREPEPRREIQGTPPSAPVLPVGIPAPGGLQLRPDGSPADAPEPTPPQWTVTGVVQGPASVAIVKDSEGNRRFVKQGDPLEEGWRVQRIERGQVILVRGKERLIIRVGQSSQASGGNEP